jgi:hypothetical protein
MERLGDFRNNFYNAYDGLYHGEDPNAYTTPTNFDRLSDMRKEVYNQNGLANAYTTPMSNNQGLGNSNRLGNFRNSLLNSIDGINRDGSPSTINNNIDVYGNKILNPTAMSRQNVASPPSASLGLDNKASLDTPSTRERHFLV